MNLRTEILQDRSKDNIQRLATWIGDDPERFGQLIYLFLHDEYRVVQRAVWVMTYVLTDHPALAHPHLPAMLAALADPIHPAVTRNLLKVFAETVDVPEAHEGTLADLAFRYLADPQQPVAIQVHAMQVIANLCTTYPELAGELLLLVEEHLPRASAGYRSRAKRILRQLENTGTPN